MHFAFKMTSLGMMFALVWEGSWSFRNILLRWNLVICSAKWNDSYGGVPCLSPANIKQCTRGDLLKELVIFLLSSETLTIWYEFMTWRVILTRWYQDSHELTSVSKELLVADFWLWNHSKPFLNGRTSQQVFLVQKDLTISWWTAFSRRCIWVLLGSLPSQLMKHRTELR